MTAPLPPDRFRLFASTDDPAPICRAGTPAGSRRRRRASLSSMAIRAAKPAARHVDTAAASGAFLVGGLVSHRCAEPLLAGEVSASEHPAGALGKAGIAGLMLAPEIAVATG